MEEMKEILNLFQNGGNLMLIGFGIWIAFKITVTVTISLSIVSAIKCLINAISKNNLIDTLKNTGVLKDMNFSSIKELLK